MAKITNQEVKALRASGLQVCGKCFRTSEEVHFYSARNSKYQCVDCRRAYMSNYREVRNKINPEVKQPKPKRAIIEQVTGEPKEYTEALELCERALLALKKSGRLMEGRPDHRRAVDPKYATVGDIMFAIHSESRRARYDIG